MENLSPKAAEDYLVNATACTLCGSGNLGRFAAETGIHFQGLENINKPTVFVSRELVVCLHCGFTAFPLREEQLGILALLLGSGSSANAKSPREDPQSPVMELLSKLLLFIDEDGKHWEHAADECENFASKLSNQDRSKMHLNSAVYRERAEMHRKLVASAQRALAGQRRIA